MRVRFWGTRGSLAKPGATTVRYGGNTSCVEVRAADGTLIVLDCGTGAHELGQALVASGAAVRGHLLITHTHWDHIQGFPFFVPLFGPGDEWDVYAPLGLGRRLEATLAGQMEYAYFPVTLSQCGATIRYHELAEGAFEVGSVRVLAQYLNHPGLALGYRLEAGGIAVVYATDHEPHAVHQVDPPSTPAEPVHAEDRRHVGFLAGADLVIHDAQYTLEEYPAKRTWGHTPAEMAVSFALAARARRLALFHHDPSRSDEALDRLLERSRRQAAACGVEIEVIAAAEGHVIELDEETPAAHPGRGAAAPPATVRADAATAKTVLIVDDEPEIVDILRLTLEPEGLRLLSAADGDAALTLARAERPDLILLDLNLPGRDGLEVCRALRRDADPRPRAVPVLMLTAAASEAETAAGFAAGVTDYVAKPFKMAHVRSRVHAWLLRRETDGPPPAAPA